MNAYEHYLDGPTYPGPTSSYDLAAEQSRAAATYLSDGEKGGRWMRMVAPAGYPDAAGPYPSEESRYSFDDPYPFASAYPSFAYLRFAGGYPLHASEYPRYADGYPRYANDYPSDSLYGQAAAGAHDVDSSVVSGGVSIIVAARNNAAYLADALRSALAQSVPSEVIYVDDGSEDESLRIAAQFPGVRAIPQPHQGVCAARNRGAAESKGEFLLFLDGDDQLPYRYVESALRAMEPGVSFCYSPAQTFGLMNVFWEVLDWDARNIWARNFVNTASLHRRSDFEAVGGWQEGIGSVWDWHLALRYARSGYRGKPVRDNFLMYRQHSASVSQSTGERGNEQAIRRVLWLTRHAASRARIGLVLSDRVFGLLTRDWLPAVRRNLQHYAARMRAEAPCGPFGAIEPNRPALEVVYTGDRRLIDVHRAIDPFADEFADVQVTRMPFRSRAPINGDHRAEASRRDGVSAFLAGAYNRLLDQPGEVFWFLEDDIIPPDHAYYELTRALLGADSLNARFAVTGCYRNRHFPEVYLLSDWPSDNPDDLRHCVELPGEPFCVDLAGTGCLAVFRPFASHAFGTHAAGVAAHDWAWCRGLAQHTDRSYPTDRKVLALPSVVCRHYRDSETFVQ